MKSFESKLEVAIPSMRQLPASQQSSSELKTPTLTAFTRTINMEFVSEVGRREMNICVLTKTCLTSVIG